MTHATTCIAMVTLAWLPWLVVGHQVDKTTQATWFLQGLNKCILDKLQGIADHSVLMDIDSVVKAATTVEANLAVAGSQGSEERFERSGRFDNKRWSPYGSKNDKGKAPFKPYEGRGKGP